MAQDSKVYRIHLWCPKCKKESETVGMMIPAPKVNCGDCLVERVEVVEMRVFAAEQL